MADSVAWSSDRTFPPLLSGMEGRRSGEASTVGAMVEREESGPVSSSDEGEASNWYCHTCGKINARCTSNCQICGRPSTERQKLYRPFFGRAAVSMRATQLRKAIEEGYNVNAADEGGWTPLHLACQAGNVELVRVLLENNALVEGQTSKGWRPLHLACKNRHRKCVQVLLKHKASPTPTTGSMQETPLHLAAASGSAEVVYLLLHHFKAAPSPRDVLGRTPLHLAAEVGAMEVAQLLLESKCDVDPVDNDGWVPRQVAEFRGRVELAKAIVNAELERQGSKVRQLPKGELPEAHWHSPIFFQGKRDQFRARQKADNRELVQVMYDGLAEDYKRGQAEKYARFMATESQKPGWREGMRVRGGEGSRIDARCRRVRIGTGGGGTDRAMRRAAEEGAGAGATNTLTNGGERDDDDDDNDDDDGHDWEDAEVRDIVLGAAQKEQGRKQEQGEKAPPPAAAGSLAARMAGNKAQHTASKDREPPLRDVVPFSVLRAKYLRAPADDAFSRPHNSPIEPAAEERLFTIAAADSATAASLAVQEMMTMDSLQSLLG